MSNVKLTTTTKREYTATFMSQDIIDLLMGRTNRFPYILSSGASVTIRVPSGGDYSGMSLDLNDVGGLMVSWTDTEVKP